MYIQNVKWRLNIKIADESFENGFLKRHLLRMGREACFISKEELQTSQNYLYIIQLF
jgi:hypothetical protein